jgi:hypothetical protein
MRCSFPSSPSNRRFYRLLMAVVAARVCAVGYSRFCSLSLFFILYIFLFPYFRGVRCFQWSPSILLSSLSLILLPMCAALGVW